jgi:hypothetical protein
LGKDPRRKLFTQNNRGEKGLNNNPKSFLSWSFLSRVCEFLSKGVQKVTLKTIRKQKHVGKLLPKKN